MNMYARCVRCILCTGSVRRALSRQTTIDPELSCAERCGEFVRGAACQCDETCVAVSGPDVQCQLSCLRFRRYPLMSHFSSGIL